MPAILGPRANLAAKFVLCAGAVGAALLLFGPWGLTRTDYATGANFVRPQPVPFSHKHHVSGLGLDCRYCHTSVETAATAGYPPTHVCMTCHSQIWTNAGVLAPVRNSLASGVPLRWTRVNRLPDYVFFDHSIHVAKGVGCTTCHGPIGDMPLTWQGASLQMKWCLDCHRDPAPNLRPRDQVFNPDWHRTADTPSGDALLAEYKIHLTGLTDCSVCHR
ncbi:MAG: cytochrome C [Alphaproteobacteria bacterium]|nr:cytochrome C [Alphaproteobacteria bacterium]